MSYKPEVIADDSGKWASNALRFATYEEAYNNARDLAHPMSTRCRIALMLWEDRMTRKPAPITLAPVLWLTRKDI